MRKFFSWCFVLVAFIATTLVLWISAGHKISLMLDRLGTIESSSKPINSLAYEGSGTGGILRLGQLALDLSPVTPQMQPLQFGTTKDNQLALSLAGKVFPFAPLRATSAETEDNLAAEVPVGDRALISIRHSAIGWPTPLNLNFMTGQSPSWKRYVYYQFSWEKPSGAKLGMLWRYEQYFYSGNGWTDATMTHENSTGLIRVDISSVAR